MIARKWGHAGTTCAIRHGVFGVPCGYVRVPEGHPFHRRGYDECDVDAWGGLTYSGALDGEDGWWLGFDMGHAGDLEHIPGTLDFLPLRTDDECVRETELLAERLAERVK